MSSLYDIKNKFVELATRDDLTEEESKELCTLLATELTNKSTNIIGFIRNTELTLDAVDIEIKRLQDMKKATTNKLEKFKSYVELNMTQLGIQEINTPLGKMSFRKLPASVEIVNEDLIPTEYIRTKTETSVDKKAILDTYKENGELVIGTRIVTDKVKLSIK
jgi:hypothetical protein